MSETGEGPTPEIQSAPEPTSQPETTEAQRGLRQKSEDFFDKYRHRAMQIGYVAAFPVAGIAVTALSVANGEPQFAFPALSAGAFGGITMGIAVSVFNRFEQSDEVEEPSIQNPNE